MKAKRALVYVNRHVLHISNHGNEPICCEITKHTWKLAIGKPTCKNCLKWDKINRATLGKQVWLLLPHIAAAAYRGDVCDTCC